MVNLLIVKVGYGVRKKHREDFRICPDIFIIQRIGGGCQEKSRVLLLIQEYLRGIFIQTLFVSNIKLFLNQFNEGFFNFRMTGNRRLFPIQRICIDGV